MDDFKNEDVSALEGTVVVWTSKYCNNGEPVRVLVVGLDYYIGVSIVKEDDHDDYYSCFSGPSSPDGKPIFEASPNLLKIWDADFKKCVEMLKAGYFNTDELPSQKLIPNPTIAELLTGVDRNPTADSCAFR